jgi:hypothetical protein
MSMIGALTGIDVMVLTQLTYPLLQQSAVEVRRAQLLRQ